MTFEANSARREDQMLNVRHYGAKGDGKTDDTSAIQRAIDEAAPCYGTVWFPVGIYRASRLQMRSAVALEAVPNWRLRHGGGTVLQLADAKAPCLLDLNGTHGVRIRGLTLDGQKLGKDIVGIDLDGKNRRGSEEDTPFLEGCCVRNFTGHGISFMNCWEWVIRNSLIIFNEGHGFVFSRWDGFFFQNMVTHNKGYGIAAMRPNASISIQGNRIEWNSRGGIHVDHGSNYQIIGNFVDRSGGPGLHLVGSVGHSGNTVTGNIFHRNGTDQERGQLGCSNVWLENAHGLSFTGNVCKAAFIDDGASQGRRSPSIGIVCQRLKESIVKDNILTLGATECLLKNSDDHDDVIIKDNLGSLTAAYVEAST